MRRVVIHNHLPVRDSDFAVGRPVSYQKNKRERGNAVIQRKSTAKANHYYIVTETEGTLLVPEYELKGESK